MQKKGQAVSIIIVAFHDPLFSTNYDTYDLALPLFLNSLGSVLRSAGQQNASTSMEAGLAVPCLQRIATQASQDW